MSFTTLAAGEFLEHVLNNADWALIGDAAGLLQSAADGNLYASLHSSDPGASGNQSTNEVAYTSYARVAVSRDGTKWTVTNNVAQNAAAVTFPKCTGSTATATHVGIGTAASSTGKLLFRAALSSSLAISNNIVPSLAAGDVTITGVTSL